MVPQGLLVLTVSNQDLMAFRDLDLTASSQHLLLMLLRDLNLMVSLRVFMALQDQLPMDSLLLTLLRDQPTLLHSPSLSCSPSLSFSLSLTVRPQVPSTALVPDHRSVLQVPSMALAPRLVPQALSMAPALRSVPQVPSTVLDQSAMDLLVDSHLRSLSRLLPRRSLSLSHRSPSSSCLSLTTSRCVDTISATMLWVPRGQRLSSLRILTSPDLIQTFQSTRRTFSEVMI